MSDQACKLHRHLGLAKNQTGYLCYEHHTSVSRLFSALLFSLRAILLPGPER